MLALVAGCAGAPQQPVSSAATTEDSAVAAIARAESATAANERAQEYLAALLELISRGDYEEAARIHGLLVAVEAESQRSLVDVLAADQRFDLDAAALNIALAVGDTALARRLSEGLRPRTPQQRSRATRLHIRALADVDDHAGAALALIDSAAQLTSADDLAPLTAAVWKHLSRLPPPLLEQLAKSRGQRDDAAAAAWLRLAHRYNTTLASTAQQRIWRAWRASNPHHVVARFPPPSIAEQPPPLRRLALLIPLSGDLAPLAEAVRDGFLGARLSAAQDDPAPTVRIYDTAAMSVADAYRRAVANGAQMVVGPLDKAAVGELARLSPELPVVALNSIEDNDVAASLAVAAESTSFPQLTLAVEEAADAIAARLVADGVERVALFESGQPGSWARRARARFETELDGATVVSAGSLGSVAEATQVVGAALGVSASSERHASLSRQLGAKLEFVPSRRQDVDALVMFVDGVEMQALKPALDFHFADDMPAYAPRQALPAEGSFLRGDGSQARLFPSRSPAEGSFLRGGGSQARLFPSRSPAEGSFLRGGGSQASRSPSRSPAEGSFEGLRVCDLPWRLYDTDLRRATADLASSRGALAPVFALGVDGYRVASQLFRFVAHGESIAGSTGQLTLGAGGRVQRELAWGQVIGGRLRAERARIGQ